MNSGRDFKKYDKIYKKQGILTKKGGLKGRYGAIPKLDKKWDRYGHSCEGQPQLNDVMNLKPKSMIDVGCGYNEFLNLVSAQEPNIILTGVDIACPGADILAPAHDIPVDDKQYDMLVSFDCMEHIPEEEVELAFKEFSRISNRIYLKIALAHSPTRIDDEPVHVCVKSKEWWLDVSKRYFPNSAIRQHSRKARLWENIIIYGDNSE